MERHTGYELKKTAEELPDALPSSGGILFDYMRTGQESSPGSNPQEARPDQERAAVPEGAEKYRQQTNPVAEMSCEQTVEKRSGMAPEARRSLVYLLRQGVLLASRKAQLFEALCTHQIPIRRHLAEVCLTLVLDEARGVAFVKSINKEEEPELESFADDEIVSLITKRPLSLYDTLLILVLRQHFQNREASGEQLIVIDQERVESHLNPFLPLTNNSKSDRKKLTSSLKRMVEKKILKKMRGDDDRYEITPIIRYVVSADFLEQLLDEYRRLANENTTTPTEPTNPPEQI